MRRAARIAAFIAGGAVAFIVLMLVLVVIAGNTPPGRRFIAATLTKVSAGAIDIAGLHGRFPDRLRADHVALASGGRTWLSADELSLDWSPLKLLLGDLSIDRLTAAAATLDALSTSSSSSTSNSVLPSRIDIEAFHVDRLTLAPAFAGRAASVSVAGDLHFQSLEQARFDLKARRLDGEGRYAASAVVTPDRVSATINAEEPANGLLAGLAGFSDIGPLSISAKLDGPRNDESLSLALAAGPARLDGKGSLDLGANTLDLDLAASAPAMAPRADLRWQSVKLDGHIHGSFKQPQAQATLAIDRLAAGAASFDSFDAQLRGSSGAVTLDGAINGLHLPGAAGNLFAAAPLKLHATAALDAASRPVTIALSHPLLEASARATTAEGINGTAEIKLGALDPIAAIAGLAVQGKAQATADFAASGASMRIGLDGTASLAGDAPAAKLLGNDAHFALKAARQGETATLESFSLTGKALRASASGALRNDALAGDWSLSLADVAPLAPQLAGSIEAQGRLGGTLDHASLEANIAARIGTSAIRPMPLTATLRLADFPSAPAGQITAQGNLLGGGLVLAASFGRNTDGALHLAIARFDWKSAQAQGDLTLPAGATLPLGRMTLRMTRLDELAPLLGEPVAGSLSASLETRQAQRKPQFQLRLDARQVAIAGNGVDRLTIDARVDDPLEKPVVGGTLDAAGITSGTVTGNAKIDAKGPIGALGLRLSADLAASGKPATLSASATANLPQRTLKLAALNASYAGETARLLRPATIGAGQGFAIKALRLGLDGAVLDLDGRITPALDLSLALHNLTAAVLRPIMPALDADGVMNLTAKLGGTLAAPTGTMRLTASDVRWRGAAARGLAAGSLAATATLKGTSAVLNARLAAGKSAEMRIAGSVPLQRAAPLDLHAGGALDLALLDPILTPNGRNARGQLKLDLALAGSFAAPRLSGSVTLAQGAVHDFVQGINITDIAGTIIAEGEALRIAKLEGRAGPGRLSLAGTVAPLSPGLPVDLTITAENARVIASDLMTATMSGALKLKGEAQTQLGLSGEIKVSRAEVTIPESLPQSVAVLNVQRPGQQPPAPTPPPLVIALDIGVDAPEQIFVRGRGIDAEFGGSLQVNGTSAAPQIGGGFDLRRGTFSLAGKTLNFTRGKIAFNGSSPGQRLDPALDLTAETTANGVTATLSVTGYADAPKIALSSSPPLPQDEVLSQLLFGQSVKQLTPLQVAEIAQALASLAGVGGGSSPLGTVRTALGLDRLAVGGASGNTSGATVEAGKYVANGIYVGAKQGVSGGTQGQVQIDLAKNLKLQTTLANGGSAPATGATPDNDPGSSIGLTYQFEY